MSKQPEKRTACSYVGSLFGSLARLCAAWCIRGASGSYTGRVRGYSQRLTLRASTHVLHRYLGSLQRPICMLLAPSIVWCHANCADVTQKPRFGKPESDSTVLLCHPPQVLSRNLPATLWDLPPSSIAAASASIPPTLCHLVEDHATLQSRFEAEIRAHFAAIWARSPVMGAAREEDVAVGLRHLLTSMAALVYRSPQLFLKVRHVGFTGGGEGGTCCTDQALACTCEGFEHGFEVLRLWT